MIHTLDLIILGTAVGANSVALIRMRQRIARLERDTHPPIDLTPAMVETLKALGVICARPPEGWHCTRPVGHRGACAAREL